MKCLNKSLPVIQDALKVIKSEPALTKILDDIGEDANLHQILSAYRRLSLPEPTSAVTKRVYLFLDRIGVNVQRVKSISVNGIKYNAAGMADFTNRLIQYVEGREDVLTEEALHFAVEILEQTNVDLFNQMLKGINGYEIYNQVLNEYKSNPQYQDKEGRPDIRKIKKEAIARKLADILITKVQEEETMQKDMAFYELWKRVVNWFNKIFKQAGFNPFDEAVAQILKEEGTPLITDIKSEGVMFHMDSSPEQDRVINRLKEISSSLVRAADDSGYSIGNFTIPKRVTDLAKDWYRRVFGETDVLKSEQRKILDDLRKEGGTAGHADLEYAAKLFVNEDGSLRETPLDDSNYVPKTNAVIYKDLRDHLQQRLNSYPPGTKFLFETRVYNGKDMAGTIDFMAITKEGKVSILDWKFMDLDIETFADVPWFKKKAFRIQINEYKKILQENYQIAPSNIEGFAIPIKAHYTNVVGADGRRTDVLSSIDIGGLDVKKETRDYLLPVSLEQQTTGDKKLDQLVKKLTGLKEIIETQPAKTPKEKFDKAQQLNAIEKALRHLQIKQSIAPLIDQAFIFTEELDRLFKFYDANFRDKDLRTVSDKDLSNMGIKLNRAFDEIELYTNLDVELMNFFKGTTSEENARLQERLKAVASAAREMKANLENTTEHFVERIADSVGIKGVMDPEVTVAGNKRLFIGTSKIQMKTLQVLFLKRREAQNKMDFATDEENRKLVGIREKYLELAKKKGWTKKNMFDILVKKGTNKLIDQFKAEFYEEAKTNLKTRNYEWIQENVDVEAYRAELDKLLAERLDFIAQKVYLGDTKADRVRQMNLEIKKTKADFDTSAPDSRGWFVNYKVLRRFPKQDKWESDEWKALNAAENKPAKDLYDWILKVNAKANESGYLPANAYERNFLPYIPKSWTESLVFGGKVSLFEQMLRSITVDEDTVGLGQIDKLSGKLVNRIPIYFTTETDKEFSTNLFENLALYNESVNRYEQISDIEGTALALGRVERNKESIVTSYWGKPSYDSTKKEFNTIKNNDKNADLYDRTVATLVYGQRYVQSDAFDVRFGSVNKLFGKVNNFFGKDILPTNFKDRQFSMNRTVDSLNNFFQMKALGLNPMPALTNLIGGHMNALINSGRIMSKNDILKSEWELSSNTFKPEEGNALLAAFKYFMPYTDDMNRDLLRQLSIDTIDTQKFQDALFWMMRQGDRFIQGTLFLSILRNQILIDGKIINARDYVRQQPEYKQKYKSEADRARIESKFEEEVASLIEKHSLMKQAKVVNNELVIPGVDRNSEQVYAIRNITREMTKKTLGNLTPDEVKGYQQNVWLRAAMVFKNWIPDSINVRYGQLKFNAATDNYEWGRARSMVRHFAVNGLRGLKEMGNLILLDIVNKKGDISLESLQNLYNYKKNDYYMSTGQEFTMSEEDFKDMVTENLRAMAKDVIFNLTGLAMYLSILAMPSDGDDDDDKIAKNHHKFMVRFLDKVTDELAFYYSPAALTQVLNTKFFPYLDVILAPYNTIKRFIKETWAIAADDEELEKETYVIKYLLGNIPVLSQFSSYMPLYAPDLAKDLGIEMSTQARAGR